MPRGCRIDSAEYYEMCILVMWTYKSAEGALSSAHNDKLLFFGSESINLFKDTLKMQLIHTVIYSEHVSNL